MCMFSKVTGEVVLQFYVICVSCLRASTLFYDQHFDTLTRHHGIRYLFLRSDGVGYRVRLAKNNDRAS